MRNILGLLLILGVAMAAPAQIVELAVTNFMMDRGTGTTSFDVVARIRLTDAQYANALGGREPSPDAPVVPVPVTIDMNGNLSAYSWGRALGTQFGFNEFSQAVPGDPVHITYNAHGEQKQEIVIRTMVVATSAHASVSSWQLSAGGITSPLNLGDTPPGSIVTIQGVGESGTDLLVNSTAIALPLLNSVR